MADPVLVTGAAGFAGRHLIELLTSERIPVIAWRRPDATRQPSPSGLGKSAAGETRAKGPAGPKGPALPVEWMEVDLLDRAAVRDAVRTVRPTAIVHCAGAAHVGRSWDNTEPTFATNVLGTHHLLDALAREAVSARVVITSSAMVYQLADRALREDDPLVPASPYGLSKVAQEMLGSRSIADGIEVIIARAFNHAGARQDPSFSTSSFARQIAEIEAGRRSPELVVGNLDTRRDITDVRDTVAAYYSLLRRGRAGRAYNVCSGHAVRVGDILEMLVARSRTPVAVRVDAALYRPNDIPVVLGDPSRIQTELGWRAAIPLGDTLDTVLEYWRRQCASS